MRTASERTLTFGLVSGILGYATVAAFFAVLDLVAGRAVAFTPSLLGQVLFYGLREPYTAAVEIGPILAFNGLHLAAFLAIGLLVAAAFEVAEHYPRVTLVIAFVGATLVAVGTVVLVGVSGPVRIVVPGWAIPSANLLALAVMIAALWELHPLLRDELRELEEEEHRESPPCPPAELTHKD